MYYITTPPKETEDVRATRFPPPDVRGAWSARGTVSKSKGRGSGLSTPGGPNAGRGLEGGPDEARAVSLVAALEANP